MSAAVVTTLIPRSNDSTAAIERYQDAYRTAEAAVTFGETVRLAGIFVGGVVFVGALVAFQLGFAERSRFPGMAIWLIACAALLVLFSQIVAAGFHVQGHLLQAALDSDVNSSPFLSNPQRARAMSLRKPSVPSLKGWDFRVHLHSLRSVGRQHLSAVLEFPNPALSIGNNGDERKQGCVGERD
jgi:hypothetical protein